MAPCRSLIVEVRQQPEVQCLNSAKSSICHPYQCKYPHLMEVRVPGSAGTEGKDHTARRLRGSLHDPLLSTSASPPPAME